jgi:hypothetical protein
MSANVLKLVKHVRQLAQRQPTVPVDCADRQADGIGQPPAASSAQPRQ